VAANADGARLRLANSIWFTQDGRFTVSRDFLQTNADFYGAGVYSVPFDDGTLNEINGWVKDNTDGMIPQILDSIPESAVMYLVNALAFEGTWIEPYDEYQVSPGEFTAEDGTKHTAEFMHSEENVYLEDTHASGFLKYYKGGKYAFAALLPEEGISVSDYAASLTGEKLTRILNSARNTPVTAALPKFETAFGTELSDVLKAMGMEAAFDPSSADFSGIGTSSGGNIFISRVLHKTFISVGEQGTKAGAATVVEMEDGCALMEEEPKRVILDRPFVYMLIDSETNLPFFIGALMNTEE
jgi:serpin B